MQYSDNKQYTIPLVKSTQWDEHTLENVIVSLTMLEDIASTIFDEVESKIDKSLAEIENIKNRVDKAQLSIKKLENAGTKTTFYSVPNFPSFSSSNIQFSLQSSSKDNEDSILSRIHNNCSLTKTPKGSHSSSDPSSTLNAFESLFATPEPVSIHDSSILNYSQIGVFSNLVCSIDPLTSYYESIPDSTYEPGEYFYSKEEEKEVVESPVSPEPCTISDDEEEEEEEEIRLTGSIYKERRETRRATGRISLMINDGIKDSHSRLSILHKPATRPPPLPKSAVPSSKPPPAVPSFKQLPSMQQSSPSRRTLSHSTPPPPPSQSLPNTRLSHSTSSQPLPSTSLSHSTPPTPSTQSVPSNRLGSSAPLPPPSQPAPSTPPPPPTQSIPTRPVNNLMSSLCAEIRASGGKVTKTNSTPPPVKPSPSPSQPSSQSRPPTPMSAGLLAEIQGADVKSILRQKREQLSASIKQEPKEENSPKTPQPQQEPQPELDMLQRRKLGYE